MSTTISSDHRGGYYVTIEGEETQHVDDWEAVLKILGEFKEIKYRRGITHDKDDLP